MFEFHPNHPGKQNPSDAERQELLNNPDVDAILRTIKTRPAHFDVTNEVHLTVQFGDDPPGGTLKTAITAHCTAGTDANNDLLLTVVALDATSVDDPFTDDLIRKYLLHALKLTLNEILGG